MRARAIGLCFSALTCFAIGTSVLAQIGTAHSVVVVAASPEARWVVLCQARADTDQDGEARTGVGYHGDLLGDRMDAFLMDAGGRETPIDDFVDVDPSGRFLAVIRDARLLLIDTANDVTTDLTARGADTEDDMSPFGGHRAGSFGEGRFLYLRERAVVVHTLIAGSETVLEAPSGDLFRAWLEGDWVHMLVVTNDTDGNGLLDWPVPRTSLGARRCRGPISSYSVMGRDGDEPTELLAPTTGGKPRAVPGFIAAFGRTLLARRGDEALVLVSEDEEAQLVPAVCRGQLLGFSAQRERVVAVCADGVIRLFWAGGQADVGTQNPVQHGDNVEAFDRLLPLPDGSILDLDSRSAHRIPGDSDVRAVAGDRALIQRGGRWLLWNVTTDETLPVARGAEYAPVVRARNVVAAAGHVVDLERFEVLGSYDGEALAVATSGQVLLAAREPDSTGWELPTGPLRWEQPRR